MRPRVIFRGIDGMAPSAGFCEWLLECVGDFAKPAGMIRLDRVFVLLAALTCIVRGEERPLKPLKDLLSPDKKLIGLWAGETPGGMEFMTFRDDGKLLMVGAAGQRAVHRWKCDASELPWKLNLVVNGDIGEANIYTVFDFPEENSFRMAPPTPYEAKRPGADVLKASKLVLKRVPFPPNAGLFQVVEAHLKGLSGQWQGITSGQKGTVTMTADGKYTMEEGSARESGRFRIDVSKAPCGIDLLPDDGSAPRYGIYEIKDGKLRFGMAKRKPEERVADFTGAAEFVRKP